MLYVHDDYHLYKNKTSKGLMLWPLGGPMAVFCREEFEKRPVNQAALQSLSLSVLTYLEIFQLVSARTDVGL